MFKGFTLVSAALFSGMLFAGTTPITTCPNLNEIYDGTSSVSQILPIVPGKLYTTMKMVLIEPDQGWAIFVGPVKASTYDSAMDVADYVVSRTSVSGELRHTEEGDLCSYNSGNSDVYVSAMIYNHSDEQNSLNKMVNKLK
jgi:hypothetical protein